MNTNPTPTPSPEAVELSHIPASHVGGTIREAIDRLFGYLEYIQPDAPRNATDPYQTGSVASYSFEDLRRIVDEIKGLDRALSAQREAHERTTKDLQDALIKLAALKIDIATLTDERDDLAAWKESALTVESRWDCQAVGKLLELPLGSDIRAQIEPKIRELIRERDEARETADYYRAQANRKGLECVELVSRLVALEEDRARYEFLRKDPPSELAVRKKVIRDGIERLLYIDGENLDYAIDAARNASKENKT